MRAPLLIPLLIVSGALWAGCGDARENPALLAAADADALIARVDEAEEAVADERCDDARRALRDAAAQVEALDSDLSVRLRENLGEWIEQARQGIGDACEEEPEETPTPESTEEPTAEPTEEPTEEPTAEPTEEPTAEPTTEPTPEQGGGTGGSSPDGGDD